MKLAFCGILLAISLVATHQHSFCQSSEVTRRADFTCYVGAGFPVGAFGGKVTGQLGHASTGFAVGAEYAYHPIEFFDLGILSNVNYNSFNAESFAQDMGSTGKASGTGYLNISLLGSVGFNVPTTQNIRFHAQGCLGIMRSTSPKVTLSGGNTQLVITSSSAFAFGYSFSAGVSIFPIDLALRYLASEPKYKYVDAVGREVKIKQPVGILQLSVGYAIPL